VLGPDGFPHALPLAYGPAPGVELLYYFLALLAWVGIALAAVVRAPLVALYRHLRGIKPGPPTEPAAASELAAKGNDAKA
jgi:hypothetical protein